MDLVLYLTAFLASMIRPGQIVLWIDVVAVLVGDYLCDHHRVDRSLRLMFSHYFIVIAVNLVTVAFRFLENPDASHLFTAGLMIAALLLFFVAIFSDSIYYHEKYRFGIKDAAESCGFLLIGAAVMLLVRFTIYGFLSGALIAVCGNYVILMMKYTKEMDRETKV